jgi:hypothetical protein
MQLTPLNLIVTHGRLELRRNFFSERVIERWNRIPATVKKRGKERCIPLWIQKTEGALYATCSSESGPVRGER